MSDKHAKKSPVAAPREGSADSPLTAGSPELAGQIAALAEQVRQLRERGGHTADAGDAATTATEASPRAVERAQDGQQAVAPAERAPTPIEPPPAAATVPPPAEDVAAAIGRLAADLIATAERAAAEIRNSAQREATRVTAQRGQRPSRLATDLLVMVNRQRQTLAVLAAETDRLGQSVEILQTNIRALDSELQAIYERLGASPRPPIWPAAAATAPAASPGTSQHRRE